MRRGRYTRLMLTGVVTALAILGLAPASASSANISHSYRAAGNIPDGSIVSLDPARSDYIQPSNTDNGSRLLGVAVASNDSLIAVDAGSGTVQVATSGTASVLASTLDGDINVGDQVAVSPFAGIGMKGLSGARVIGLAQTALNNRSSGLTTQQVKDRKGKTTSVKIGYVQVSIAIGTDTSDSNLTALQRLVKGMTGHVVSTFKIVTSLAVLIVAVVVMGTLVYASIYGGIVSVGRNPLGKSAVARTLMWVMALGAVTMVVSGGTIFLLLQ